MKFTLDTNIFVDGFRSEDAQADVFAFLNRALPFTYLSAVVMQELAAGARTAGAARDVQRGVFEPFERRRRVFTPSSAAFAASGRVLAAVAAREGWRLLDEKPSLLKRRTDRCVVPRAGHYARHEGRGFQTPRPVRQGFSLCGAMAGGGRGLDRTRVAGGRTRSRTDTPNTSGSEIRAAPPTLPASTARGTSPSGTA